MLIVETDSMLQYQEPTPDLTVLIVSTMQRVWPGTMTAVISAHAQQDLLDNTVKQVLS